MVILRELYNRPFPMLIGSRGLSKTMMLALYSMLKAVLNQGSRIVVCGTGLRQSRLVFEYCLKIWEDSDMLRDLMYSSGKGDQGPKTMIDKLLFKLGDSEITFIPIGSGEKVRGLRASILITDEFQHQNPEIFEVVLSGFTSVSQSPIQSMQYTGRMKAMRYMGVPISGDDEQFSTNQSIISGTAYYSFNHFCAYWKKWKSIIESEGDTNKLEEVFQGEIPPKFNWKDYSVMRIPVEMIPDGFMDEKSIAKAKVSMHSAGYQMEYGAVFSTDSTGFFKRTLIESCVARDIDPIDVDGVKVTFNPRIKGNVNLRYVIGIDPASERDRFSIVVIEIHDSHRRIVYCWTTVKSEFKKRMKEGGSVVNDFYQFCARKIRDLMEIFPTERIIMDSQGGGYVIEEALHNSSYLKPGEIPVYQIVEEDKEKPSDIESGLHILELAQFSKAEWVSTANHGMRQDFENKILLFPDYDAAILSLAQMEDEVKDRKYDTMEDCIIEIEELKDELATIVHTQTGTQLRDRWDTPEIKLAQNKKGRMRKDRYSALLMANMAARIIQSTKPINSEFYGSVVAAGEKKKMTGKMWVSAPDWFVNGINMPGIAVPKNPIFDGR